MIDDAGTVTRGDAETIGSNTNLLQRVGGKSGGLQLLRRCAQLGAKRSESTINLSGNLCMHLGISGATDVSGA